MYSYSQSFGLSDFQNGLLFSLFSICTFLSTPIIGRLSDKYGRKPLLLISLFGTVISFLMTAYAKNAGMLFAARALDGITAGNIPVALAVISDTTLPKDRAKGFGIIGATFGFGFVFGPAISGLTLRYGIATPFIVAACVTGIAMLLTALFLPETNMHEKEVAKGKLFDFRTLFMSITDERVGITLGMTLLFSLAHAMYVYAFQPFSIKTLGLSPASISYIFMGIGVVGLLVQGFLMGKAVKRFREHGVLTVCLIFDVVIFILMFLSRSIIPFVILVVLQAFFSSFISPILQTLLSKEVDEKSQGTVMGLSSSYGSIGTIIGPLLGGAVASISVHTPFLIVSCIAFFCFIFSLSRVRNHITHKLHAFRM